MLVHLRNFLFPPQCAHCGDVGSGLCEACAPFGVRRTRGLAHLRVTALGEYEGALRSAILAVKDGRRDAARGLGERMARLLQDDDVIIPVPTSARRRRSRGIDGVDAIARAAAPWRVRRLLCLSGGDAQRGRSRAQRMAARGRFMLAENLIQPERRLVLVDDVCTTGATLEDCARVLRGAGLSVEMAVVAALA